MDYLNLIFGIGFILFGIYTLIMRKKSPEKFYKLEAMKKQFGEKKGDLIHLVSYAILPITLGIVFLFKELI